MNENLHDALEWVVAQYSHGTRLVLLFDYDGTLVEFADTPSHAFLSQATSHALEALALKPGVTVGVISGRELEDLKQMVRLPGIFYAGTSGLEVELQGQTITHPLVAHSVPMLTAIAEALEAMLVQFSGAWLERKRFGLTVHYRQLDPKVVPLLHGEVDAVLSCWADRLHVVTGAKAVDITPNVGWTKGTAVEFLLERLNPEACLVVYAGDEANDVEALWRVGIHGGIAIGVGESPPSTAQYKLTDVRAVEHLLDDLCHTLGSGTATHAV